MVNKACKDGARSVSKMKKTEIGVIPEDWEVKAIKDCCQIIVGGDVDFNSFSEVTDSKFKYPIFSNTVSNKGLYGYSSNFKVEANSVTVVGRGIGIGTAFPRIGRYTPIGRLIVLDLSNKNINNHFLSNYINSKLEIFDESGGIPQLTGVSLGKYQIPLPPLPEQEAIASALSDADAWIESLEQLIAKKRLIKQGTMQTLLTPPSEELVLSGVEAWEVKKLWGLIENIIDNRGKTPPIDKNGYNLLEVNSLGSRHPDLNKVSKFISQFNYDNFLRKYLKIGDLLFSTVGNIGKTSIYNDINSCIAQNIVGFRFSKCNSYFMKYYFDTNIMQSRFESILMSGVQPSIKVTQLIRLEILIPSSSEQERIATILSDMDAELESLENQLAKARQIKQGVMQELLSGRTRLV